MAGISNADPEQIRLAQEILGGRLVSVQNQFSPAFRSSEPELRLCDELGIAFLPWSPLGGISKAGELGSQPSRRSQEVADAHGVSPQQVTPGLDAGHLAGGHPDPGLVAARDHPRLRRRGRPGADRGRAAAALHHRLSRASHDAVRRPARGWAGGTTCRRRAAGQPVRGARRGSVGWRGSSAHLPRRGHHRAPHPRGRHPARRPRRPDRHAHRLGGPAARSRRRGLPRPARRLRRRPGGRPRRGARRGAARTTCATSTCVKVDRRGRAAPRGQRQPRPAHRRDRGRRRDIEVLNESAPLPFQIDERVTVGEEARLKHRYLDLRRPAPAGPRSGCAARSTAAARERARRRATSSRSRPRR